MTDREWGRMAIVIIVIVHRNTVVRSLWQWYVVNDSVQIESRNRKKKPTNRVPAEKNMLY